tara:strand:+ start:515 stop:727 length:213 start_codon:yes stop_codon:yes gene_type:complete
MGWTGSPRSRRVQCWTAPGACWEADKKVVKNAKLADASIADASIADASIAAPADASIRVPNEGEHTGVNI